MKKTAFALCAALALSGLAAALSLAQGQSARDVPGNVLEIIKKHRAFIAERFSPLSVEQCVTLRSLLKTIEPA